MDADVCTSKQMGTGPGNFAQQGLGSRKSVQAQQSLLGCQQAAAVAADAARHLLLLVTICAA